MSDSVRPYGQQSTRLLCPQDSLDKNTGVDFHVLLHITRWSVPKSHEKCWTGWSTSWNQDCRQKYLSDQIRSVAQSCPTLCDPVNCSTPGLPVYHQLPEFTETHVHRVSDAIQPSHPLSSPSPPAPNPSQHQSLFQWVNSSHEVATVLEFQL